MLIRRVLLTLAVAGAGATLARAAEAQLPLKYGVQAAVMTGVGDVNATLAGAGVPDLNGKFGLGARAALQPPLLPIGVVGQGVYYFPAGNLNYLTYSLAAQLRLPLPMINPYAIAGWQWRRTSGDNIDANTQSGFMGGVGVQLNLAVALFLEGTFEIGKDLSGAAANYDNTGFVIKGGVMFGG